MESYSRTEALSPLSFHQSDTLFVKLSTQLTPKAFASSVTLQLCSLPPSFTLCCTVKLVKRIRMGAQAQRQEANLLTASLSHSLTHSLTHSLSLSE